MQPHQQPFLALLLPSLCLVGGSSSPSAFGIAGNTHEHVQRTHHRSSTTAGSSDGGGKRATPLGEGWQLVAIDDALVAKRSPNLVRRYHSMVKHPANPVMQASFPWEEPNVYVYGSVWASHDRRDTLQMYVVPTPNNACCKVGQLVRLTIAVMHDQDRQLSNCCAYSSSSVFLWPSRDSCHAAGARSFFLRSSAALHVEARLNRRAASGLTDVDAPRNRYYSGLPIGPNGSIAVFNGTNFSGSHVNYAESTDGQMLHISLRGGALPFEHSERKHWPARVVGCLHG